MSSSWIPFNYLDVSGFQSCLGLPLSTPSNEAAKLYDAAVAELIFHDPDPVHGDLPATLKKMHEADPDFAAGQAMMYGLEMFDTDPVRSPDLVKKIFDLSEKTKNAKNISDWEKLHVRGVVCLANEDLPGFEQAMTEILARYPKDPYALQMAYFSELYMGHNSAMRDLPARVVDEFNPGDRYYANTHGKLCFGFVESYQYPEAEKEGLLAIEAGPKDLWSAHALAHLYHETNRCKIGIDFLDKIEPQWGIGSGLKQHNWWHKALYYVQLGEYEEALLLYDGTMKPHLKEDHGSFPLSDAASLLLRLELEDVPINKNLDITDRWREIGQYYEQQDDFSRSLFYDAHLLVGSLYGECPVTAQKLRDSLRDQLLDPESPRSKKGWNRGIFERIGTELLDGITAYHAKDYETAVQLLHPIRNQFDLIAGSRAQRDIFDQVLLVAAVKSKSYRPMAKQMIKARVAKQGITDEANFNQRMMAKIETLA